MSELPGPAAHADITARLRAAGCVFAEEEAALLLAAAGGPQLEAMVARRCAGEPLEHVLGWAELGGVRVAVGPGVFVPRRRSELLVRTAAALGRQVRDAGHERPLMVVDLCCGSGAIGAALVAALGPVRLHAVDVDPAAVRCARRNLAPYGGRVHQGDLFAALPQELRNRVALIVANAPYVPTDAVGTLPVEARLHEPRVALDGGADGLDVVRRVLVEAPRWLAPGGAVVVEVTARQAPLAMEVAERSGLTPAVTSDGHLEATVVSGTNPGTPSRQQPGDQRAR